jgi:hypothetical protein
LRLSSEEKIDSAELATLLESYGRVLRKLRNKREAKVAENRAAALKRNPETDWVVDVSQLAVKSAAGTSHR